MLTWLNVPGSPSAFLCRVKGHTLTLWVESVDVLLRCHSLSSVLLERAPDVRLALSSAISPRQRLLDCEFRLCLKYEDGAQCPVCHTVVDPYGDHHVGCGGNGDRHPSQPLRLGGKFLCQRVPSQPPWMSFPGYHLVSAWCPAFIGFWRVYPPVLCYFHIRLIHACRFIWPTFWAFCAYMVAICDVP